MDITDIIDLIKNDPKIASIIDILKPFIPIIKRHGIDVYNDVVKYAINGEWTELDKVMWSKMNDEERDALSTQILSDAREAVDREFERRKTAREVAIKLATTVLTSLL